MSSENEETANPLGTPGGGSVATEFVEVGHGEDDVELHLMKKAAATNKPTPPHENGEDMDTSISAMLEKARLDGNNARFWLSVVPRYLAIILFLVCLASYLFGITFLSFFNPFAWLVMYYSLLPSDKLAIRRVVGFSGAWTLIFGVMWIIMGVSVFVAYSNHSNNTKCYADELLIPAFEHYDGEEMQVLCSWMLVSGVSRFILGVFSISIGICEFHALITTKDSGPLLDWSLWLTGLTFSACVPMIMIPLLVVIICVGGHSLLITEYSVNGVVFLVSGLLLMYPGRLRTAVRTFLLSRVEHGTAASVAGFLGGHSPDMVQATAKKLLRAVHLNQVLKEEMANNDPDPLLLEKTISVNPGQVDAFVTHSWHDDSELKWEQLQAYRHDFKQAHGGREPLVWIDKYCLDQENLGEGLMCLPVFLASCNSLLVLAGSTYAFRLWCVMELFIFLIMGGSESAVDLRLLCSTKNAGERQNLVEELETFDARQATCSVQEDADKLTGAIAGAFGDLDTFSSNVRQSLSSILSRDGTRTEQEIAQLRSRITELELVNARYEQRFTKLESQLREVLTLNEL